MMETVLKLIKYLSPLTLILTMMFENVIAESEAVKLESAVPVVKEVKTDADVKQTALLKQLKERLDNIKTLKGEFEQNISDKNGKELQVSEGSFLLKRPGYFYWETEEPFPQIVIGEPKKLSMYDPDLEQLNIYPRGTDHETNPARLLSGELTELRSSFTISAPDKSKSKKSRLFILSPIEQDSAYRSITFRFKKDKLEGLVFVDRLEQTTDIKFVGTEENKPVDSQQFVFSPPEGTDIIVNE